MRNLLISGSLLAAVGVALGAFGAHALRGRLDPALLATWQTAVQYHLAHALGILLIALLIPKLGMHATWSGWLMVAGIFLFSGSLYLLAITGVRWLGAVTPLGGLAFIAGWLLLAFAAWKSSAA